MRIAVLSSFYPLRGGIAQFNAHIVGELGKSHSVKAFNFKRQYPGLLFPGKTQYVTPDDEATPVESEALLDTIRPSTWVRTARAIRAWKPDLLVLRYWMSWFAPSLGWVARHAGCPVVAILDNVIPHEPHFFDRPLTKYFLRGCGMKNLLFFGLIRDYKGLDILLEAFRDLPDDYQLIVAGEPYGSFDKYRAIIDSLPGKDRVHVFPDYIRDAEVKRFFSAADVTVLPYRSATQSGIGAISLHFGVPMIVTDTGGLKAAVGDRGTGLVVPAAEPGAIREAILRFFGDPSLRAACGRAIEAEKERLSWTRFCTGLTGFAGQL